MDKLINEKKQMALALTMPRREDFITDKYRKDPEYAQMMVKDEFQEYVVTSFDYHAITGN